MNYAFLADATAVTHATSIVLLIVGLLVCFRFKRFRPLESGILLTVILLWSYYGNCPLTIVEQYFRDLAGEEANLTSVGFLPYYANKLFDVSFSSRIVQRTTFFTGGVLFASSIEWLSPYFHLHLFHFRKSVRRLLRRIFA